MPFIIAAVLGLLAMVFTGATMTPASVERDLQEYEQNVRDHARPFAPPQNPGTFDIGSQSHPKRIRINPFTAPKS